MINNYTDIIEVKDEATDEQIELLQKCNPDSLILRESDDKLLKIYRHYKKSIWNKVFGKQLD